MDGLDKDCFYTQFLKRGAMQIVQRNSTVVSHSGAGCLISASDPYDAIYRTKAQALYLEIPREPFLARLTDGAETSVQHARLRSIKAFIDENLSNPSLSLVLIAKRMDVSLSYLHHLFKDSGECASEWIWLRRLQRCYEMITLADHAQTSITDMAYSMGFSSSSHFSTLFRETFGIRPSDLRRPRREGQGDERKG